MKLKSKYMSILDFSGMLIFSIFYFLWDIEKLNLDFRFLLILWGAYFVSFHYKYINTKALIVPLILILHLFFIHFTFGTEIQLRSLLSVLLASLLVIFFIFYRKNLPFFLFKSASIFFTINLLFQLLEIFEVLNLSTKASDFLPNTPRFSGLFHEPSHLAIFYAPFLCTYFSDIPKFRKYIDFKFIAFAVSSLIIAPSTTMFFIFSLSLILHFLFHRSLKCAVLLLFFFCFVIGIKNNLISLSYRANLLFDYFSAPNFGYLSNPAGIEDITSLVFLYNYNTSIYGLINFPFGVGINSYEFLRGEAKDAIIGFAHTYPIVDLNVNDGSSNLFKLIGEFGIFLLLPLAILVKNVINSFRENDFMFNFSLLLVLGSFGRGVGYFSSGFFISILYLLLYKKNEL